MDDDVPQPVKIIHEDKLRTICLGKLFRLIQKMIKGSTKNCLELQLANLEEKETHINDKKVFKDGNMQGRFPR